MKIINNGKVIKYDDCYPCYSLKLNDFLQEEKHLMPIRATLNKKTEKTCYVFIKSKELDMALNEWTERKKSGNLYYPNNKEDGGKR